MDAHASIDIGSNTLRLLIAAPSSNKHSGQPWQEIAYAHFIVRLGEGLHHTGRLSDAGMARAIAALKSFKATIDEHHIADEHIFAVATAAVREAENGLEFQQRVIDEVGIHLHIIDGDTEAATSLMGAGSVLHPQTRKEMLLFDIGGGSTEFIRVHDGSIVDAISRKLGVVRLIDAHLHSDPPSPEDFQAMKESANEHLAAVEAHWNQSEGNIPSCMVGTAGTVTTLAAVEMNLIPYNAEKVNNHLITLASFQKLRDRLLNMNHEQRQNIPTIETGRADLIIGGLAIIEAMMERWNYDAFISVDAGLLQGNWLASYDTTSK